MIRKIYKYGLQVTDWQTISLPLDAHILCVQTQGGRPQLWAFVDPDPTVPLETRTFRTVGTGHPFEESGMTYLGTYQMHGALVFHVFESLQ